MTTQNTTDSNEQQGEARRVFCAFHLASSGHIYPFDECMVEPCPSARRVLAAASSSLPAEPVQPMQIEINPSAPEHDLAEAREIVEEFFPPDANPEAQWKTGLIRSVAFALSARDAEVRKVLEGLVTYAGTTERCWCRIRKGGSPEHGFALKTASAPKSRLTEPDRRFVAHHL